MNEKKKYLIPYHLQMFGKDGPGGEKTETATSKKLADARKEGQVAKSKELNSAVELIALFVILKFFVSYFATGMKDGFQTIYNKIPDIVDGAVGGFSIQAYKHIQDLVVIDILMILAPIFVVGISVVVIISLIQVKWNPTTKPLQPKLNKINPISGFKKIFSKDSLFELVKAIVKIGVIMYVAYAAIEDKQDKIFLLYDMSLNQAIGLAGSIAIDVGFNISVVYFLIGLIDYMYQSHKFKTDMKMTKQEVKDEFKNSEGNPEIKGRQKSKMREASQKRMMQDLPKADVIITNPTHLAIAIKYEANTATAPIVVAKGEDYLAMKIREVAKENKIEIVENKPLARMLYANVAVGQEVPPELYQAVAEVLAMVYSLKQK